MNSLIAKLADLGPFEPSPHIAIAVSGGADSMALTLLAAEWAHQHGGRITALTVDHRLRPESTAEAAQVATWLNARNISHHILTPEHAHAGNNLSAAARQWRYEALTGWCRTQHVLHLLVAHHQHDQAETRYLMQARGTGTDGAAAMPWVRNHAGVRILRPLLATPRGALRDYLQQQNQPWVEDPSNNDTTHARIQARNALHANPSDMANLLAEASTAAHARATADDAHARASYQCVQLNPAARTASMPHHAFCALPETEASRLLADLLRSLRGTHTRPRKHETQRLCHALRANEPHHTLYGYKITLNQGHIHFQPEAKTPHSADVVNVAVAPARFWA